MDYNKYTFDKEERSLLLTESELLLQKYPDRVPILVQIDSKILKINKHKFLVSDQVSLTHYVDILKQKLVDLHPNDVLDISVVKYIDNRKIAIPVLMTDILLKEFYKENVDYSTKMLILTLSRKTTYKRIKNSIGYYLGY